MMLCCAAPPARSRGKGGRELEPEPRQNLQHEPEPEPEPPEQPERARARRSSSRREARRQGAEAAAIREVKQHRRLRLEREQQREANAAAATVDEARAEGEAGDVPAGWAPLGERLSLTLAVPLDADEAIAVRQPFEQVGLRVVEVLRVQNRPLWRRFATERELLAQLHGAGWEPNERRLYHATSQDALTLAEGPGLDERFSSGGGNLGRAIYCASNPRKAHQYARGSAVTRIRELRRRQVLVVRCILGDCLRLARGETRRDWVKEPPKPPGLARRGSCGEYDSVAGEPQPPTYFEEFAIYNRYRVYPEFIVVYDDMTALPSRQLIDEFMEGLPTEQGSRKAATTFEEEAIDWLLAAQLDVVAAIEAFNKYNNA
jgi:hypothetical protein